MKTIIVATDYSSTAENALAYAARIAQHCGSKLVLFNALSSPVPTFEAMMALPDIQEQIAENEERLNEIASETGVKYGVTVEAKCGLPPLQEELEDLCRQYEDPLVVVGMRGDSLERKLFGSRTTEVVRQGNYPVLVIPAEACFRDIAKILFACDYNRLSGPQQLSPLKELALSFKARIEILHVERTPALAIQDSISKPKGGPRLESIFRGIKHSYKEIEKEDIIEGIEKGIKEYNADILVMVPHKPGYWDYILNRSNTRKMALRTNIPLLAIPNPSQD